MYISLCLLVFLGRRILRGIALEGGTRTMFEGAGVYHVGHLFITCLVSTLK